ncbi:MAG: hypothetical protein ACXWKH_20210 [Limisphaerales bacterium]
MWRSLSDAQTYCVGWVNYFWREDVSVKGRLEVLEKKVMTMATEQDIADIKAAYEAANADLQTDVGTILTKLQTLTDEIKASSSPSPNAAALVQEITANATAVHAKLNPTPDPVQPAS